MRKTNLDDWWPWLLAITVILVIGHFLWKHREYLQRLIYHNHRLLFLDLCRAHGLEWRERRLLQQLAHSLALQPPTRIFVERQCFDPDKVPAALSSSRDEIQELGRKLFD